MAEAEVVGRWKLTDLFAEAGAEQIDATLGALEQAVDEAIAAHPEEFGRLRDGDQKLIGFFVGRVMQVTQGKADPREVSRLLRERAG